MSMYATVSDITALYAIEEEDEEDGAQEEEEEENFVMTALFCATEEGNLPGIKELLESATNFDINQKNRHGETVLHMAASGGHTDIIKYLETKGIDLNVKDRHGDSAVYWAARQGHADVIQYLSEQGVSLNTQNKAGEAAVHVAARYGHTEVVDYLCRADIDINLQDKLGESALHNAAWHGLPRICTLLTTANCKLDLRTKEDETPLHSAALRGNLDCVRLLIQAGANLNMVEKRGHTPLHLACHRRNITIALLLLHAGCQMDIVDQAGDSALHAASKEGLQAVVQTMCAFGCNVHIMNKMGNSALHMASKAGHLEVARCLLLSGADPDLPNMDSVTPEIMALAQGFNDCGELLAKARPERREGYVKQLTPTTQPLSRIKLKVFGHSGVGKTTLIDSLKCGYIGGFFRRARLTSTNSVGHSRSKSCENGFQRHHSLPTQLSYEVVHNSYTKGIDIQPIHIAGAGDLSIWEFSGYEPYYMAYDHFIGDVNCIHTVVFNLQDPLEVQLTQITFWLNFIKARIPAVEPIGHCGKLVQPPKVVLVASHADKVNCAKNAQNEHTNVDGNALLATVKEKFYADFDISDHLYVMDAHLALSADMKAFKVHLGELKALIVKHLHYSNGFYDSAVAALTQWRKTAAQYPVYAWQEFVEQLRLKVNILASEEHLRELIHQLQLAGEVVYLETDGDHDLVVINPRWMGVDVIGQLLSHEKILQSRPTGCFTVDDIQLMYLEVEAPCLLQILEALEICSHCDIDGEVEYEFPCFNFVEALTGLWEKDSLRYQGAVYGGVRIKTQRGVENQLMHLFPRIQVHLRRSTLQDNNNPENDLYQWHHGSKFCCGNMESLITLEENDQAIEVKARGPSDSRTQLYYFLEDICSIIEQVITDSCPGLCTDRHILSATHLRGHKDPSEVHTYTTRDLLSAQLQNCTRMTLEDGSKENFHDLVCFGSEDIKPLITLGVDLHISHLTLNTRRQLSLLLDVSDPMGRDWCMLAVLLGLSQNLPQLDETKSHLESRTDRTLAEWSRDTQSTIAQLIKKLEELGRQDAIETILRGAVLFKVFQDETSQDEGPSTMAPSHSSDNTLSNLSR